MANATTDAPKARQIHKEGEVNISAYFPAEVKASLRMVQAKTGNNVKECLAEALHDLFKKYNVSVSAAMGEGR
ncbi:ribbon-helix-helix domain-containing protein [Burkholderia gladioli]|uniref:ribbon-helix-helix domain-containing protein n=1 Tax=Burkholderia gladioli TaxID=28095 RepID=UPI00164170FA|nr:ribbon-helix-helix domain-containing protein [Burkholderia gladioli]